jgi:pyruvate/2-oxoglutarate dehydrogenase complex dihydrolipoamide acyltransferase (E2) component
MAHRLVRLAVENPVLNSTIIGGERHEYSAVNLGFTLQSDTRLSLLSVRNAETLTALAFVQQLQSLMRRGMKEQLRLEDTNDVTVSFSSMSKWDVTRHMPVLPPFTSLIVAHASTRAGIGSLGATYDHRVLTGGEVAAALQLLSTPPPTVGD